MTFELPRIPMIGLSNEQLQIYWQKVVEAIEAQENAQNDVISQLAGVVSDLADAVAAITQAQSDATAAAREAARIASYPNPGSILTASDAGTNATIHIANHTRVYPVQGSIDVPDRSITGGDLTARAYSTRYYVYYDDATLTDATPNFQTTTSSATAQVGAASGRHFLGYIDTPASGGTTTDGSGTAPPGGGGGGGPQGGYIP